MQAGTSGRPRAAGDVLTLGFGTTVAMWAVGYVLRMPEVEAPGWLVAAALFGCLLGGGWLTGRLTTGGWRRGALVGLVVAALNLLIVGGTVQGDEGRASSLALAWVPGTLLVTAIIMGLGAMAGGRRVETFPRDDDGPLEGKVINWTGWFALVAVAATGLLLVAGGLVTGRAAGLAVPDWPQVFGYNMFLYPLARMTGNIYYEHTHRLVGALVGLTTIGLAVHLWMVWTRRWWVWAAATMGILVATAGLWAVLAMSGMAEWVPFAWLGVTVLMALAAAAPGLRRHIWPWLAGLAVVAVIAQGVLGGYRVELAITGAEGVQYAYAEHETPLSAVLRVAHGVYGQVFLAIMVALAVASSRLWRQSGSGVPAVAPSTDQILAVAAVVGLIGQLLLGALVRHLGMEPMAHIVVAALLTILIIAVAVRAWGIYGKYEPTIKRLGVAMVVLVLVQLLLGVGALVVTGIWPSIEGAPFQRVIFTTLHQANGAALLGAATALMVLYFRVLRQDELRVGHGAWRRERLIDEPGVGMPRSD